MLMAMKDGNQHLEETKIHPNEKMIGRFQKFLENRIITCCILKRKFN